MIFMDYIFYFSVNWWFDTCEPVIVVFIFHEVLVGGCYFPNFPSCIVVT